ncbi:hypothetical protein LTR85_003083 [Meristemomyces frigidus]|nr:hypothetical protein LTR85_003083 [Meristemomyces frigidus]
MSSQVYTGSGATLTTKLDIFTEAVTISAWSTTSTASIAAVNREGTYTPVYVFGSEPLSISYDTYTIAETNYVGSFTPQPPCCQYTSALADDCGVCEIFGGTVQLLYWPSTSATQNGSQTNYTGTITAPPATATTLGLTLTSPSVYISFQSAFATNACGYVGQNHTGFVISMRPQDVSSVVGYVVFDYEPLNYTNLDFSEVILPLSVYEDQCFELCETIAPEEYRPYLSVPSAILNLDPAWATCQANLGGVYDPPIPLQPANSVAGVSTVAGTSRSTESVSAEPSSTPAAATPTPTASTAAETSTESQSIAGSSEYTSDSTGASSQRSTSSPSDAASTQSTTGGDPSSSDPATSANRQSSTSVNAAPTQSGNDDSGYTTGSTGVSSQRPTSSPSDAAHTQSTTGGDPSSGDPATPANQQSSTSANAAPTQSGNDDSGYTSDSTGALSQRPTSSPSDAAPAQSTASSDPSSNNPTTSIDPQSTTNADAAPMQSGDNDGSVHDPTTTPSQPSNADPDAGSGSSAGSPAITTTIGSGPAAVTVVSHGSAPSANSEQGTVSDDGVSPQGSAVAAGISAYVPSSSGSGVQAATNGVTSTIASLPTTAAAGQGGNNGYTVDGHTISAGGSPATVSGTVYSALSASSGVQIVASGFTSTSQNAATAGDIYVVAGSTLSAGGSAVATSGTVYSALPASSGLQIVAGGFTSTIQTTATAGDTYVVAGSTLFAGGSAVAISGTVYSALPSGAGVEAIGNGGTSTVSDAAVTQPSEFVVAGTTYSVGGQALVTDGTTYSVLPSGEGIQAVSGVVTRTVPAADGSALNIAQGISATPVAGSSALQGQTPAISKLADGDVVIGSNTLIPGGPAATVQGHVYSLVSDGILSVGTESTSGSSSQSVNALLDAIISVADGTVSGQPVVTSSTSSGGGLTLSAGTVLGSSSALNDGSGATSVSVAGSTASSIETSATAALVRPMSFLGLFASLGMIAGLVCLQ